MPDFALCLLPSISVMGLLLQPLFLIFLCRPPFPITTKELVGSATLSNYLSRLYPPKSISYSLLASPGLAQTSNHERVELRALTTALSGQPPPRDQVGLLNAATGLIGGTGGSLDVSPDKVEPWPRVSEFEASKMGMHCPDEGATQTDNSVLIHTE